MTALTCLVSLISCSSDIPPLQDQQSGILKHDPREISDKIFNYLKNIFSGSDGPPTQPPPVIEEEVLLDESSVGPAAQDDNSSDEPGIQNGIPPGGPGVHIDHEYSANARSQPPKSGSGGKIDDDPAGFLEKEFSAVEVSSIVNALGNGKAAGHDFIINEALKEAPEAFIALLTKLFNMVKSRGRIPRSWSRGQVVLIHKKGPVSDINNYRPLTVLTCMCATYSKVLNARLTEVVEKHKLLGEVQNGFRKDGSCVDSAFTLN